MKTNHVQLILIFLITSSPFVSLSSNLSHYFLTNVLLFCPKTSCFVASLGPHFLVKAQTYAKIVCFLCVSKNI